MLVSGGACMLSSFSCVRVFATPWTVAARLLCPWDHSNKNLEWVAIPFCKRSSWPRGWTCVTCVSCLSRLVLYHWATWEAQWGVESFSVVSGFLWIDLKRCNLNKKKGREQVLQISERKVVHAKKQQGLQTLPSACYSFYSSLFCKWSFIGKQLHLL